MAKKEEKKAAKTEHAPQSGAAGQVSRDEQIGYHKGSLMTLSKERQELMRILGIVEQLMQMHASALSDLGVKTDEATGQASTPAAKPKKPPIEDIL
jgi:hypothetical protein